MTQLLWQIGGAQAESLRDCPAHERAKFLLLAALNITLAATAALVCAAGLGEFLATGKVSPLLQYAPTLVGVIVFVLVLPVLVSAVRALAGARRRFERFEVPAGVTLELVSRTAIVLALLPGLILAGLVSIPVAYLVEIGIGAKVETWFLFGATAILFTSPVAVAKAWASPVYDRLFSRAPQDGLAAELSSVAEATQVAKSALSAANQAPAPSEDLANDERSLRKLFEQYPDSRQLGEQLIGVQRRLGLFDDAVVVYDMLIGKHPRDVDLLRAKAQLYREKGDEDRYRKTLEEADRVLAGLSFESNIGKAITVREFDGSDLEFFADFHWPLQPEVNILLGRNGYGKSYLLRALVALLQDDEDETRGFVANGGQRARLRMSIDREGSIAEAIRSKLLFELRFGKVPVLAIPDMRYIDKSKGTVGSAGGEVSDLKSQGARNFLREESYEGLITNFLYGLCLDQLDPKQRPDTTLVELVERSVESLSGSKFQFQKISRKDNARFEILVFTEGSTEPLPIQRASQGTLSVVAMVGLIFRYLEAVYPSVAPADVAEQRAIVVIDEIDAHLHPSWQQRILELFRNTFPNVQFIVTAHSPLVVAGARGGEVAVLAPADGRFKVQVIERHFIGATFDDLYTTIFGVERVDATFKHLGTQIAKKAELEAKARRLEQKKERTAQEDNALAELRDELYYLRVYEEQQTLQDRRANLESENQALRRQNMELKSQVDGLAEQLSRTNAIAKSITDEPTEVTRRFFADLLEQTPANAAVVADHIGALIQDGRPAVAGAALDALSHTGTSDLEVLKRVAVGYETLERYGEAREALEKAIALEPKEPGLRSALERLSKLS